jgi:hypothetical protein
VHAARGLRRVWAWIWAWIWAQWGVGVFGGVCGEGLGGVVGARGATWWWSSCPRLHVRTASKKPRHATKSKLHADSDCFTCTRATRANPNRHSSESKDENSVSNHRLGQFQISASLSRYFKPPNIFARIRAAALQASLRALTAHSTAACCAIYKSPKQEIWLRTT